MPDRLHRVALAVFLAVAFVLAGFIFLMWFAGSSTDEAAANAIVLAAVLPIAWIVLVIAGAVGLGRHALWALLAAPAALYPYLILVLLNLACSGWSIAGVQCPAT